MPYVPLSWLNDHVQLRPGTDAAQLAADLVKVGLEEERVVPPAVTGPLVVGRVLTMVAEAQSNGKTINYCRVDVGQYNDQPGAGKEPSELASRGIVCGAHNFAPGDLVAVVLPGAVLPGPFPISARKTYGHVSDGMICSERELGMSDEHDGILVLTRNFALEQIPAVGQSLLELLDLGEEILEINVTPDRGYCFSMRGVAREYHHSTGAEFTDRGSVQVLPGGKAPVTTATGFAVEIHDQAPIRSRQGCDRFVTRIVRGIDPLAQSPSWLVKRLEAAGMRSISLAVDVTNYVMLDLGQPLHAYDLDKLCAPIVVRRAAAGESLVTLDGVCRQLDPQDLLIADCQGGHAQRVLGIAGVMGGADSEVSANTTAVLIEAAHFDPVTIARSARRHHLPSEASKRFERGVDPQLPPVAAQAVVDLLVKYGGASADEAIFDLDRTVAPSPILMDFRYPAHLVGVDYPSEQVIATLEEIGCEVAWSANPDQLAVTAPSWRPDLTAPADLVEEVARLCGYDFIPSILPDSRAGRGYTAAQKGRRQVAQALAVRGLTQVLSYPFVGNVHDRLGLSGGDPRRNCLRLSNPIADDAPALRTSILDSLLPIAERNYARGTDSFGLFELGLVTHPEGMVTCPLPSASVRPDDDTVAALLAGVPKQPWHLGAVLVGSAQNNPVLSASRDYDWADAVDIVRMVASVLGVRVEVRQAYLSKEISLRKPGRPSTDLTEYQPEAVLPWHPGRCAAIVVGSGNDVKRIGLAGQLHPNVCKEFGLGKSACALEIDLEALLDNMSTQAVQVQAVSAFPVVKEDLAFVVPSEVPAVWVQDSVRAGFGDLVEEVEIFDVYTGQQLEAGTKSLALSIRLRAIDRTLTAADSAKLRSKVITRAQRSLNAKLRS